MQKPNRIFKTISKQKNPTKNKHLISTTTQVEQSLMLPDEDAPILNSDDERVEDPHVSSIPSSCSFLFPGENTQRSFIARHVPFDDEDDDCTWGMIPDRVKADLGILEGRRRTVNSEETNRTISRTRILIHEDASGRRDQTGRGDDEKAKKMFRLSSGFERFQGQRRLKSPPALPIQNGDVITPKIQQDDGKKQTTRRKKGKKVESKHPTLVTSFPDTADPAANKVRRRTGSKKDHSTESILCPPTHTPSLYNGKTDTKKDGSNESVICPPPRTPSLYNGIISTRSITPVNDPRVRRLQPSRVQELNHLPINKENHGSNMSPALLRSVRKKQSTPSPFTNIPSHLQANIIPRSDTCTRTSSSLLWTPSLETPSHPLLNSTSAPNLKWEGMDVETPSRRCKPTSPGDLMNHLRKISAGRMSDDENNNGYSGEDEGALSDDRKPLNAWERTERALRYRPLRDVEHCNNSTCQKDDPMSRRIPEKRSVQPAHEISPKRDPSKLLFPTQMPTSGSPSSSPDSPAKLQRSITSYLSLPGPPSVPKLAVSSDRTFDCDLLTHKRRKLDDEESLHSVDYYMTGKDVLSDSNSWISDDTLTSVPSDSVSSTDSSEIEEGMNDFFSRCRREEQESINDGSSSSQEMDTQSTRLDFMESDRDDFESRIVEEGISPLNSSEANVGEQEFIAKSQNARLDSINKDDFESSRNIEERLSPVNNSEANVGEQEFIARSQSPRPDFIESDRYDFGPSRDIEERKSPVNNSEATVGEQESIARSQSTRPDFIESDRDDFEPSRNGDDPQLPENTLETNVEEEKPISKSQSTRPDFLESDRDEFEPSRNDEEQRSPVNTSETNLGEQNFIAKSPSSSPVFISNEQATTPLNDLLDTELPMSSPSSIVYASFSLPYDFDPQLLRNVEFPDDFSLDKNFLNEVGEGCGSLKIDEDVVECVPASYERDEMDTDQFAPDIRVRASLSEDHGLSELPGTVSVTGEKFEPDQTQYNETEECTMRTEIMEGLNGVIAGDDTQLMSPTLEMDAGYLSPQFGEQSWHPSTIDPASRDDERGLESRHAIFNETEAGLNDTELEPTLPIDTTPEFYTHKGENSINTDAGVIDCNVPGSSEKAPNDEVSDIATFPTPSPLKTQRRDSLSASSHLFKRRKSYATPDFPSSISESSVDRVFLEIGQWTSNVSENRSVSQRNPLLTPNHLTFDWKDRDFDSNSHSPPKQSDCLTLDNIHASAEVLENVPVDGVATNDMNNHGSSIPYSSASYPEFSQKAQDRRDRNHVTNRQVNSQSFSKLDDFDDELFHDIGTQCLAELDGVASEHFKAGSEGAAETLHGKQNTSHTMNEAEKEQMKVFVPEEKSNLEPAAFPSIPDVTSPVAPLPPENEVRSDPSCTIDVSLATYGTFTTGRNKPLPAVAISHEQVLKRAAEIGIVLDSAADPMSSLGSLKLNGLGGKTLSILRMEAENKWNCKPSVAKSSCVHSKSVKSADVEQSLNLAGHKRSGDELSRNIASTEPIGVETKRSRTDDHDASQFQSVDTSGRKDYSTFGFSTARGRKLTPPPPATLQRMEEIFNEESIQEPSSSSREEVATGGNEHPTSERTAATDQMLPLFEHSGVDSNEPVVSRKVEKSNTGHAIIERSVPYEPPALGFFTAGGKRLAAPSSAAFENAAQLFNKEPMYLGTDESNANQHHDTRRTLKNDDLCQMQNITLGHQKSADDIVCASHQDAGVPISLGAFTTARGGRLEPVSLSAKRKAMQLLADDYEDFKVPLLSTTLHPWEGPKPEAPLERDNVQCVPGEIVNGHTETPDSTQSLLLSVNQPMSSTDLSTVNQISSKAIGNSGPSDVDRVPVNVGFSSASGKSLKPLSESALARGKSLLDLGDDVPVISIPKSEETASTAPVHIRATGFSSASGKALRPISESALARSKALLDLDGPPSDLVPQFVSTAEEASRKVESNAWEFCGELISDTISTATDRKAKDERAQARNFCDDLDDSVPIRSIPADPFAGFSTASGRQLNPVSEKALAQANKFLDDDAMNESVRNAENMKGSIIVPELPHADPFALQGFATATGRPLNAPSGEARARARKLWDDEFAKEISVQRIEDLEDPGNEPAPISADPFRPVSKRVRTSNHSATDELIDDQVRANILPTTGFSSASGKKLAPPSEAAQMLAKNLLSSKEEDKSMESSPKVPTCPKNLSKEHSSAGFSSASGKSLRPPSKNARAHAQLLLDTELPKVSNDDGFDNGFTSTSVPPQTPVPNREGNFGMENRTPHQTPNIRNMRKFENAVPLKCDNEEEDWASFFEKENRHAKSSTNLGKRNMALSEDRRVKIEDATPMKCASLTTPQKKSDAALFITPLKNPAVVSRKPYNRELRSDFNESGMMNGGGALSIGMPQIGMDSPTVSVACPIKQIVTPFKKKAPMTPLISRTAASTPTRTPTRFGTPFKSHRKPVAGSATKTPGQRPGFPGSTANPLSTKQTNESRAVQKPSCVFSLTCADSRIKLKDFVCGRPPNMDSTADLIARGISADIIGMTVENARSYEFRPDSTGRSWGAQEAHADLVEHGAAERLMGQKWITNHYGWIVWKLACMVRAYPDAFPVSLWWSREKVLHQLLYRYEREVNQAVRSPLRRLIEGDDTFMRLIVLCVSQIDRTSEGEQPLGLELTDGWYKITADIDPALQRAITDQRLRAGDKICVGGAKLSGKPVSALDVTDERKIRLTGNTTRRARWDAKLGYQRSRDLLFSLSTLLQDGGEIATLDVIIMRRYPESFLEITADGKRIIRNKQDEETTQNAHELRKEDEMNKILGQQEKLESNATKGTNVEDRGGRKKVNSTKLETPDELYDAWIHHPDPENFVQQLKDDQVKSLQSGMEERRYKEMEKKQEAMSLKFSEQDWQRNVTPFFKLRICDYGKNNRQKGQATVTVWRHNEALFKQLAEGSRYRIKGLGVSPKKEKEKLTQLRASKYTSWQELPVDKDELERSAFKPREAIPCDQLSETDFEIDLCVVVLVSSSMDPAIEHGKNSAPSTLKVFVTDATRSLVVVEFAQQFGARNLHMLLKPRRVITMTNLAFKFREPAQGIPFLECTMDSEITGLSTHPTLKVGYANLENWATQNPDVLEGLRQEAARLMLNEPMQIVTPPSRCAESETEIYYGYIVSFPTPMTHSVNEERMFAIDVDVGFGPLLNVQIDRHALIMLFNKAFASSSKNEGDLDSSVDDNAGRWIQSVRDGVATSASDPVLSREILLHRRASLQNSDLQQLSPADFVHWLFYHLRVVPNEQCYTVQPLDEKSTICVQKDHVNGNAYSGLRLESGKRGDEQSSKALKAPEEYEGSEHDRQDNDSASAVNGTVETLQRISHSAKPEDEIADMLISLESSAMHTADVAWFPISQTEFDTLRRFFADALLPTQFKFLLQKLDDEMNTALQVEPVVESTIRCQELLSGAFRKL